jgi:glycosyltransferase involved in cell wall biosynthesis
MRIAVVANTTWYLSNFRLNLMRALQAQGHTVVAAAPVDGYAERIRAAGIEFEHLPISGGGTNPLVEAGSVIGLWRMLRRQRIDVVLSYTPKGNLYSAFACIVLGKPFVPNVSGLGRAFIRRSALTMVAQSMYKMTFPRSHRVFFQNQDDMDVFVRGGLVRPSQAERIPGSGVDLARFVALPLVVRGDREPVFLLVARMLWDKGVGEYVEAARRVRAQFPGARFQLLGFLDVDNPSAVSRAQMDLWVAEGVVEYLGQTDDVRPMLIQADCVVLPSNYREGVPRTLLEAAASARPVITTDMPGCRDTVLEGQSGFLCKPLDALDLGSQMLRFIALSRAQREAMGEKGRALAETRFDERFVLQRYLAVVADIAIQQPSRSPTI